MAGEIIPESRATSVGISTQLKVLAAAMFYWRCEHQPVQFAGECRHWREAYERDYAAFTAKYGKDKN